MILELTKPRSLKIYVNSEHIVSFTTGRDGTALYLQGIDGQVDIVESPEQIRTMLGGTPVNKEVVVNAIDDARRSLDVWTAHRGVADAIWFGRISDMMSKLGRIETAVLS